MVGGYLFCVIEFARSSSTEFYMINFNIVSICVISSCKAQLTKSNRGPEASVQWLSLPCFPGKRRLVSERSLKPVIQLLTICNFG